MKENATLSTPCENAAERIQYWFGKDKELLFCLKNPTAISQDFCKMYKCDLVKPPRIPSQIDHLPLQEYVLSKRKKQTKQRKVTKENPLNKPLRFSVDQAHCCVNQKNLSYLQKENPLSSNRVAQCHLKEHFLVSKRLKYLSKQKTTGPKRHDVIRIKSTSQQDPSQNPYLQEWGKVKEERHFQIGRVIKYLID